MIIEKTPKQVNRYRRNITYFDSARSGFSFILSYYAHKKSIVLLPSFIGVSPNEGSGIFDPVKKSRIPYQFYALDKMLAINIEIFRDTVEQLAKQYTHIIVLLVHYYGFVDPSIDKICKIARNVNAIIIEDEAHALYTDYIDGMCGNYGDFSLFSLHKMLPCLYGGMVRDNVGSGLLESCDCALKLSERPIDILQYDLAKISKKRKEIAKSIYEELNDIDGMSFLWPYNSSITPQTIPIVLPAKVRNDFYFVMNDSGYGVVSLYHTLIGEIIDAGFSDAFELSKRITNLPVHQDIQIEDIKPMCVKIKAFLYQNFEKGII
jgi:dTDP-4-amino-4,6-dideoxygalactose transaminase